MTERAVLRALTVALILATGVVEVALFVLIDGRGRPAAPARPGERVVSFDRNAPLLDTPMPTVASPLGGEAGRGLVTRWEVWP